MAEHTMIEEPAYKTYVEYIKDVNEGGRYDAFLKDLKLHANPVFKEKILVFSFFDLHPEGKVTQHYFQTGGSCAEKLGEIMSSLRKQADVSSRIVIIHEPSIKNLFDSFLPTWAVDILGLGASIEPSFFEKYYATLQRRRYTRAWCKKNGIHVRERVIKENSQYLTFGGDWMLILNQPTLPKTVLIILGHRTTNAENWRSPDTTKSPLEVLGEKATLMSSDTSGRTTEPPVRIRADTPTNADRLITSLHKCALEASKYGSHAFLFSCIEALVEYHSTFMPHNMPIFDDWDGPFDLSAEFNEARLPDSPQVLWNLLRTEVDDTRLFLNRFPEFVSKNFDVHEPIIGDAFRRVEEKYKKHIARIEAVETRFRDQLSIVSSAKGVEMAQLSIRESKRVMLLTLLAFVFVPISLATSIFGMNVQEINGTGHGLWVFIVTTILLLVIAALLFAIFTMIMKYRRHLIRRGRIPWGRHWVARSIVERLLFVPRTI